MLTANELRAFLAEPGTWVNLWRTSRGATLRDMASRTGLSVSYLSDIEQGRTSPSLKTFRKLLRSIEEEAND